MSNVIPRILAVEDELPIQELLRTFLATSGFEVDVAGTGEVALEAISRELPELVLIDWMLPGMSGLQLIHHLRDDPRTRLLPIILLTARGAEADRVAGLEAGADDYVAKPFSPKELVARIRAVLRRRAPQFAGDAIEFLGVRIDPGTVTVTVDGDECTLNPTEFKLLRQLMSAPGRVFSRGQLLDLVWGDHRYVEERTVDVAIRRLRQALGARGENLVITVRGLGYRFANGG